MSGKKPRFEFDFVINGRTAKAGRRNSAAVNGAAKPSNTKARSTRVVKLAPEIKRGRGRPPKAPNAPTQRYYTRKRRRISDFTAMIADLAAAIETIGNDQMRETLHAVYRVSARFHEMAKSDDWPEFGLFAREYQ